MVAKVLFSGLVITAPISKYCSSLWKGKRFAIRKDSLKLAGPRRVGKNLGAVPTRKGVHDDVCGLGAKAAGFSHCVGSWTSTFCEALPTVSGTPLSTSGRIPNAKPGGIFKPDSLTATGIPD